MVFFDSNILLYVLAEGDSRQEVAAGLLARGGAISVQVLNEFASVAHRKLKLSWPEVSQALADIRLFCSAPVPLAAATHETALAIAERTGYGFYDALILAAAFESGCDTVYSEDMQNGQVIDGRLTIRNPFRQN